MTKIYVRERVKAGEKQPRYRVVAVTGSGLQISAPHFRRDEIERIAKDAGAEVIYLEPE
ncbi:MAG: hypothetical protein SVE93_00345 [Candidatus Thermoplasmatota archaeon]|nr:hypothetical protein [Candidatus Thermoplasmatota archaeon]